MKILISEKLSAHKYKTPEGYLICTDAILARTGKQTYTHNEVFNDGDSSEVEVDRPYDQVMNEKTLASFENKPVTWDHPSEEVNVGNYKELSVGYVRDVHQGKIDGQDVILGNLVITDQDAINAIESGEHTDLSCGYDCDIVEDEAGFAQHNIRGNHIALCQQGRAGNARIVDSIKDDAIENAVKRGKLTNRLYSGKYGMKGKRSEFEQLKKEIERRGYRNVQFESNPYVSYNIFFEDSLENDVLHAIDSHIRCISINSMKELNEVKKIADSKGVKIIYNDDTGKATFVYDSIHDAYEALWYADKSMKGDYQTKEFASKQQMLTFYNQHKNDSDKFGWWLTRRDSDWNVIENIDVDDSIRDSKYYVGLSKWDYTKADAEADARKYGLRLQIEGKSRDPNVEYDAYLVGPRTNIMKMLKATGNEDFASDIEDSIRAAVKEDDVDSANYVVGRNGVWFARAKGEHSLLSKAYCSSDRGKTWHNCYLEVKSEHKAQPGRTQAGKYFFRTSSSFDGPRTSIGRNVLTWYAANGKHNVDENYQIDHIDNDYRNDDLSNLQRITEKENLYKMNEYKKSKHDSNDSIHDDFGTVEQYMKSHSLDWQELSIWYNDREHIRLDEMQKLRNKHVYRAERDRWKGNTILFVEDSKMKDDSPAEIDKLMSDIGWKYRSLPKERRNNKIFEELKHLKPELTLREVIDAIYHDYGIESEAEEKQMIAIAKKYFKDSIEDISFKYLTESEKELKEALGLYKKIEGSHTKASTGISEKKHRQNQFNNPQVAELNEAINEAIHNLNSGVKDKSAWQRLSMKVEAWESDPEYAVVAKKAKAAIRKFMAYIAKDSMSVNDALNVVAIIKKLSMKDYLPRYSDAVADKVFDILDEMNIDFDGDIESGIAIPTSKVQAFESKLRQKGIQFEEYHEGRSSKQGISFFDSKMRRSVLKI